MIWGKTVTRNPYIALPLGPVIAKYDKRIVNELTREGVLIQRDEENGAKPVVLKKREESLLLTHEEIELAHEIGKLFSEEFSSGRASVISHRNEGWEIAFKLGYDAGKPPRAIDMNIALQQIVDEDPWMDEPIDPAVINAIRRPTADSKEW